MSDRLSLEGKLEERVSNDVDIVDLCKIYSRLKERVYQDGKTDMPLYSILSELYITIRELATEKYEVPQYLISDILSSIIKRGEGE